MRAKGNLDREVLFAPMPCPLPRFYRNPGRVLDFPHFSGKINYLDLERRKSKEVAKSVSSSLCYLCTSILPPACCVAFIGLICKIIIMAPVSQGGLNQIKLVKCLEQCLAHSKHFINVRYQCKYCINQNNLFCCVSGQHCFCLLYRAVYQDLYLMRVSFSSWQGIFTIFSG